jgi:hypothetical protein
MSIDKPSYSQLENDIAEHQRAAEEVAAHAQRLELVLTVRPWVKGVRSGLPSVWGRLRILSPLLRPLLPLEHTQNAADPPAKLAGVIAVRSTSLPSLLFPPDAWSLCVRYQSRRLSFTQISFPATTGDFA